MKQADVKELSLNELNDKLENLESTLTSLTMQHAVSPLENPLKIRETRRAIARLETELRKREIAGTTK